MSVYYNEIDRYCAQWLQNLIDAGRIPQGVIDTRSIEDVRPDELAGYTQCHFFAGLGGWAYALDLAGWPHDRPVWTGSCPCQPFSSAGKGAGFADERHLWPAFHHLIAQCRPAVILGEQVASKDADPWVDLVHADLEGMGYAFGCVRFPSAGIGAPHVRDRAYWVADTGRAGLPQRIGDGRVQREALGASARQAADGDGSPGRMADRQWPARQRRTATMRRGTTTAAARRQQCGGEQRQQPQDGSAGRMGYALDESRQRFTRGVLGTQASEHRERRTVDGCLPLRSEHAGTSVAAGAGPTNGFWRDADWLGCTDGKWRPVEPGTFPLAHGIPNRVGRLRAYGNAINPWQAAEFIHAFLDVEDARSTA